MKKIFIGLIAILLIAPIITRAAGTLDDQKSTSAGLAKVVAANNQLAFDLYTRLAASKKPADNLFFSPYSIATALAMTDEGAKGQTAAEINKVFHFSNLSAMRPDFARLINIINKPDKKYQLSTANALWAQQNYKFLDQYFATVAKFYGGQVTNLDFIKNAESCRSTINQWVEQQTNNKITNLLPAGSINNLTRLVLTNAIYFLGNWDKPFDKRDTHNDKFTLPGNKVVNLPTMRQQHRFAYAETASEQVLSLPYQDNELSMMIILPKNKKITNLRSFLTATKYTQWQKQFQSTLVGIKLPKFKFDASHNLKTYLSAMGMPTAFSNKANFSGMTGTLDLKIDQVIHKAYIDVNEQGTEAAAATAVVMGATAMGPEPAPKIINFIVDHPFIFLIKENSTGAILFLGQVSTPSLK